MLLLIMAYSTFRCENIRIHGLNSAIFLILYAIFRIIIEMFREPDLHIGFILNNLTMGQILSLPMLVAGIYLMIDLFRIKKCRLIIK
jgi:phosphatidylglycerol:prolipoprotein diacylglycerol transferase